jgi:protein-L-isoaspartate(D-aspartate) O-methyltransferase
VDPRALDPPEARDLRARLVADLAAAGDLRSERVTQAMLRVPRHLFVPEGLTLEEAYANCPQPIGLGQTISQPTVVALMTEALELDGEERVLEIGTGSGYQAAVLSVLAREVYSIEIFAELAEHSASRLSELGYANVHVRLGDGSAGWPEQAPFDRVLATAAAAAPDAPHRWIDQLREGGTLVAPVGPTMRQRLVRYSRHRGAVTEEYLGPVSFVPLLGASEAPDEHQPGPRAHHRR